MTFEKVGGTYIAEGVGWKYYRIGTLTQFRQNGKVKSLRKVKTFIKVCNKLSEGENKVSFVEEE